jgi:putative ATPase
MEPLASRIRPRKLEDFVGQSHLVGPGAPLRQAIEEKHLFSFVLWGPPGVGKTTLARIYAESLNASFFELSAVSAGKADVKQIVDSQPRSQSQFQWDTSPTVLFLDEIHRFNKAQQDYLLPYVERGELTLIGATTENPSFEVIAPLLSRLKVFVLNPLSAEELGAIIDRALFTLQPQAEVPGAARDWLIAYADGDARRAITVLETAQKLYGGVSIESLQKTAQSKHLRYDKAGEEHYNVISAFIKSMRASQPDAALYYLARMIEAGEDPKFIARRMVIFASEDIGMAEPMALLVANEVFRAVETVGLPEAGLNLAHGAIYLAAAPKTKAVCEALDAAMEDAKNFGALPVPLNIRNAPTKLMQELGYGAGYEKYTEEDLLPEALRGRKYYKLKGRE